MKSLMLVPTIVPPPVMTLSSLNARQSGGRACGDTAVDQQSTAVS
jgi:hypothetical protein